MFNPNEHFTDLKGKKYLQVMWRLVWFREDKPNWCIDTKLEKLEENSAVFSAKIYDENGVLKSAGYGSESIKDFRDFIEKAETKAVGRALAMLGYGTQFAPELDEDQRIVDSPVDTKPKETRREAPKQEQKFPKKSQFMIPPESDEPVFCVDCGKRFPDYFDGTRMQKALELSEKSILKNGRAICPSCARKLKDAS